MNWRALIVSGAQDIVALAGAVAVGYGLWLIYEPAMWVWAGAVLLVTSYGWQRGSGRK